MVCTSSPRRPRTCLARKAVRPFPIIRVPAHPSIHRPRGHSRGCPSHRDIPVQGLASSSSSPADRHARRSIRRLRSCESYEADRDIVTPHPPSARPRPPARGCEVASMVRMDDAISCIYSAISAVSHTQTTPSRPSSFHHVPPLYYTPYIIHLTIY